MEYLDEVTGRNLLEFISKENISKNMSFLFKKILLINIYRECISVENLYQSHPYYQDLRTSEDIILKIDMDELKQIRKNLSISNKESLSRITKNIYEIFLQLQEKIGTFVLKDENFVKSINIQTLKIISGFPVDFEEERKLLVETLKKAMDFYQQNNNKTADDTALSLTRENAALAEKDERKRQDIELANQNVALNGFSNHEGIAADCFEYLKQCQKTYDIIVLDPPAFAKHSRAVANASRGYQSLNKLGIEKVKPGGLIFTFSCSQHIDKDLFRKIVFSAAAECKRNVRIVRQLSQPDDHPINIYHPEGEYLKGLLLHVE
jgi:16S rRNA G966 N2-methylase RsmD